MRGIDGPVILKAEVTALDYEGVIINGSFDFSLTQIKTLKGSPARVNGDFYCSHAFGLNGIQSLEGAPSHVGGAFCCYHSCIASLHNVHKQIKYIGSYLKLPNTIKSHVIGVMLIKGLQGIVISDGYDEHNQVVSIINRYLKGSRDPHACQEELLEAGFVEYAKL